MQTELHSALQNLGMQEGITCWPGIFGLDYWYWPEAAYQKIDMEKRKTRFE